MVLSDRQRQDLHQHLLEYLRVNGFAASVEILEQELQEVAVQQPPPQSQLERRYNMLLRLQRQLAERDDRIKALEQKVEELADPTQRAQQHRKRDLMPDARAQHVLKGHTADVNALCFHPSQPFLCSAADDGRAKVWDYDTGQSDRTLSGHCGGVKCVAFDHEGQHLATGSDDMDIKIFNWEKGEPIRSLHGHEHTVSWVEFVPPQSLQLVSASRDRTCKVWDWNASTCVRTFRQHNEWVRFARVNRSGRMAVSADDNGQLLLWSVGGDDRGAAKVVGAHGSGGGSGVVEFAVFANHAAEEVLAKGLGGKDGDAHADPAAGGDGTSPRHNAGALTGAAADAVAAARERRRKAREAGEAGQTVAADPHADSRFIASAGRDKEIHIFDLSNCSRVRTLSGHDDWVRGLAFHSNGKSLLSCSDDGQVRVWDVANGRVLKRIDSAHDGDFVSSLAYHPAGRFLASSAKKEVKVWPCK